MDRVHIFDHPMIHHKISYLRDKTTSTADFRNLVEELALLMRLRFWPTCNLRRRSGNAAGNCSLPPRRRRRARHRADPARRFGHGAWFSKAPAICARRPHRTARNEETHEPEAYYYKMPPGVEDATVIVVDPMLATGGSACDAIATLKAHGVTRFKFVCLIASEAGIAPSFR